MSECGRKASYRHYREAWRAAMRVWRRDQIRLRIYRRGGAFYLTSSEVRR